MPENSTPDNHIKTRKEFLRILNRWKSKVGYMFELHGVLDITDFKNAHWDVVGYSDAPVKPLKAAIADAWKRSGGKWRGWSLEAVSPSELPAVAKYTAKDTANPANARAYLPASQKEMGMELQWSTSGFWVRSQEALWGEWKQEWFGQDKGKDDGTAPIVDNTFRTKMVGKLKGLTPDWEGYLRGFSWHNSDQCSGSSVDLEDLLELIACNE